MQIAEISHKGHHNTITFFWGEFFPRGVGCRGSGMNLGPDVPLTLMLARCWGKIKL